MATALHPERLPSRTAEASDWRNLFGGLRQGQLHPEGWYAVALSSEVVPGRITGRPFLNGRVAVYRQRSGEPVVVTEPKSAARQPARA